MDKFLLQQVYGKYSREIFAYLYTLCGNRSLAEDLLQETFLKAILSLPNTHENVRAWLYKVARNLYFNHSRRSTRELTEDEPPADSETSAEDTVLSRLEQQALYRALLKLEGAKREVIMMQYFSGLPQKEIAAILGISPENVRVLSYRAKKELKKSMEDDGYDLP